MSKHYNKRILCKHYRCFTVTSIRPLGDTEWYYCHSEAEGTFVVTLGNGRKIKGRVWVDGSSEEEYPECVFYIRDEQFPYDEVDDDFVSSLAKKMRVTESCIYEMLFDIRSYVSRNIPKRDYNSEILPRVPHINWLSMEAKRVGDYEDYDQFIGTSNISLRIPDGEKLVSITVRDYSCGPEYGSRVITTTNLDGHLYNIGYGSMDDASILYGRELYRALHTAEKEIGLPCGTLMPIIERVRCRLKDRLNVI